MGEPSPESAAGRQRARDVDDVLFGVRDTLLGLYERRDLDQRVITAIASDRLALLQVATALSEAWTSYIEDDNIDPVVLAVGELRMVLAKMAPA